MNMEDKLEIFQEMHDKIMHMCEQHWSIAHKYGSVVRFEIEGDYIEYTTEDWLPRGGGVEYDEGRFPIEYLWDENWYETAKAEHEAKEAEKKRKADEEATRKAVEKEERQYKEYLALKEKYEQ